LQFVAPGSNPDKKTMRRGTKVIFFFLHNSETFVF
jgi:hypothetical protein